ncbi:MAG TPA: hypothetical protein VG095_05240, partial [Chthoniobacterales bacterium]|nr:hypothetical protein [Chthoniobacterales bacterium]
IEALCYLSPWRVWLCLIVALTIALILYAYGVCFVWPFDVFIVAAILGIALGLYWEERVA